MIKKLELCLLFGFSAYTNIPGTETKTMPCFSNVRDSQQVSGGS